MLTTTKFQLEVKRFISLAEGSIYTDVRFFNIKITPFSYQLLRNISKGDILNIKGVGSNLVVDRIHGDALLDGTQHIVIKCQ